MHQNYKMSFIKGLTRKTIDGPKNENMNVMPLLEIEKAYLLFQNAHFRPVAEMEYQYDKTKLMEVTGGEQQQSRGLFQVINDARSRSPEKIKKYQKSEAKRFRRYSIKHRYSIQKDYHRKSDYNRRGPRNN